MVRWFWLTGSFTYACFDESDECLKPPNVHSRLFIENILNFLGVSLTLFAVAHAYMYVSHNKIIKPTVRCRYCKKFISVQV